MESRCGVFVSTLVCFNKLQYLSIFARQDLARTFDVTPGPFTTARQDLYYRPQRDKARAKILCQDLYYCCQDLYYKPSLSDSVSLRGHAEQMCL